MADELVLRPFGVLPEVATGEINDNVDNIPASHDYGTVNQKDIGITPNQLNRITMLTCDSAANEDKVGTYSSGLSLEGNATECIGREVYVTFKNANTKENPTFTYTNSAGVTYLTGPIKLLNDITATVSTNLTADGSTLKMVWDGTNWLASGLLSTDDKNDVITIAEDYDTVLDDNSYNDPQFLEATEKVP